MSCIMGCTGAHNIMLLLAMDAKDLLTRLSLYCSMYVIVIFHFAAGLVRPMLMPKPLKPSVCVRHVDETSFSKESLSPDQPVTFPNDAQIGSPCKDSLPTPSGWQVNYGTTMCDSIQ